MKSLLEIHFCRTRETKEGGDNEVGRAGARNPQYVHDLPEKLRCDLCKQVEVIVEMTRPNSDTTKQCQNVKMVGCFLREDGNSPSIRQIHATAQEKVTPPKQLAGKTPPTPPPSTFGDGVAKVLCRFFSLFTPIEYDLFFKGVAFIFTKIKQHAKDSASAVIVPSA